MAGKRELIEPHKGDKRYVRRDEQGRFSEVDDVSRSLSQDQKRSAKTKIETGSGRPRRSVVFEVAPCSVGLWPTSGP